ncbi:hypothetical protein BC826DRAFT_992690 [Russula brevipes]|nr:hypothetical protein BC826DRAFT_992690 [Russula brevipes]
MHSVSDLTTFSRKTSGDVPPKLVGASTTVVGDSVYLYGGRLVTERRMVTDMYVFGLKTLVWEKVVAPADDCTPAQRYFHSADSWNQYLIIFGGMGLKPDSDDSTEDLCVLNDVCFYDIPARRWMPPSWSLNENPLVPLPKPRYAHLSSVSGDRLFIIGGQDLESVWLDDVYIYDLSTRAWVLKRDYPRHCGTYRSVAVSADFRVHLPQEEARNPSPGPGKPLFRAGKMPSAPTPLTPRDTLIHLPYSAQPTDDFPNEIFLYSNYNFTDVKRELEVLTPLPNGDFTDRDASSSMNGPAFPPGLRFPAGAILGTHLIIAGTYLAHSFQSFSVWALNLIDMSWSRIDPGSTLTTGSWFRSGLWARANKFIVFGNRQGSLVDDYNRRLLSWDHIAMIDLEAFGIYQPPNLELDIRMQEMGLAALEEGILADFEIVCDDDRRVKCSRKLLEDRWPWFKEQKRLFHQAANRALDTLPLSATHVALPDVPSTTQEPRSDPRLTSRLLILSEPYPITLALVQYFYSLALVTPLQHAPAVLSALLVLATNYDLGHLQSLVKHAMHRALSNSTSVGVYEVATLCSCRSLQIRALKTVMLFNQKRPSTRSRQDREGGPSRAPDTNGNSGGSGAGDEAPTARPRGMSDALMRPSDPRQLGGGGVVRGGNVTTFAKDDPDSLPRGTASGSKPTQLFLSRKPRSHDKILMSRAGMLDEASEELAIIAELHAPVIIDASEPALTEDTPPTHGDSHVHQSRRQFSKPERSGLRVDTQIGHLLLRPTATIASSTGLSPTPTSESDRDESRSRKAVHRVASLPSYHLPLRTRSTSYRDRGLETPPLTSASHSSLTSSSAVSRSSSLYTPPTATIQFLRSHRNSDPRFPLVGNQRAAKCRGKSTQTLTRTNYLGPSSSSSTAHSESDEQEHPRTVHHGCHGPALRRLGRAAQYPRVPFRHRRHGLADGHGDCPPSARLGPVLRHGGIARALPADPDAALRHLARAVAVDRVQRPPQRVVPDGQDAAQGGNGGGEAAEEGGGARAQGAARGGPQGARGGAAEGGRRQRALGREQRAYGSVRAWEEDIAVYGGLASM